MDFKSGKTMEEMVESHTGLVKTVALKFSYIYNEELEDLIQIGFIGLMKAAQRFEPERGLAFSTYAVPMIAGEIKSQLRDQGIIKVSRSLKSDGAALRRAENDFIARTGRSPRLSELASETGLSPDRVSQALAAMDAVKNIEDFEKSGLWTDDEDKTITKMDMTAALDSLPERDRQVILLRYFKDMTQQQVANILGISQVQVCRIEKKSLKIIEEKCKIMLQF
ncbi:MAG: sigma-70 family RNA polymerase sigma factor [Firmicutes bacterium]|nr:sigma-70 family RNA polymerase sigma factor [Bacillota bacterium]